ncbi:putative serine/threonine protein kinase [Aspergillus aculeatinus CBS 121060]|uniref:Serine/threonine protein kinase n=1 Tax=Aspergillus aculeatinus CBS 121060 TaxID=1448322 RepID=A0ACD1GTA0_9EURO|nr:putative serine/threonine protein kinase [Aspergillus aculeatinus CBS 121060]RAH64429.1 putative serine/threonine protein kinase [Aspergillus aculeatinus CBS 121060]
MECLKNNFVEGQLLDGRFRTVAPLNHGSFGMVFLAKDLQTGQDVAIKCMTKSSSGDPSNPSPYDARAEELECHRRLRFHPNIVNLIHSFETDAHMYLVLEYCSNGDLYEAIRLNRGPLETEHVRDFMLQLVSAVEFMHANGLYHRDIKPENIFLMQDGSMKLGDFGLATREAWSHEACVGSDRYMAPEQYDPSTVGYSPAKADVWAIGICLLNVLFARNPFATPTESDILYADYVRDRQSLFDIFPNMSQDTFEILRTALAIDPTKRSLSGIREAILRAVTFTTDDDALDEFCTDDREVVAASANREPLRTPSIQSPHVNQGDSFPWAKALQASPPQTFRQLSAIPDNESYTEDLFPPSEIAGTSWFSVHQGTPSMASVLESAMGESLRSPPFRKNEVRFPPPSDPVPITGSLPSNATKPLPSLSMVFGKKKEEQISKSWSDLWDEEEESEAEDLAYQQRREQNSRSWSHESSTPELRGPLTGLHEVVSNSLLNVRAQQLETSHEDTEKFVSKSWDPRAGITAIKTPPQSPDSSPQKSSLDKWSALGDRRRNFKSPETSSGKKFSSNMSWRKDWGLGSSGFDYGSWAKKETFSPPDRERRRRPFQEKGRRRDAWESPKAAHSKAANHYDGSVDEDLDLVGGWHDLHL